jgi:hypothetical protein
MASIITRVYVSLASLVELVRPMMIIVSLIRAKMEEFVK